MIIICIFLINKITIRVNAESANFYEGEYINGIYMSKYQYSTKKIYYQKARFFRQIGTNEHAYCIEPFSFFNETEKYETTVNLYYLTENQINKITKIAHFGYGYKNHTDEKWYAITQMMIWKESDPNSGRYYFTEGLNGKEINIYQDEMNEINNLINDYETIPDTLTKEITIIENEKIKLEINNNNNYYKTDDNDIKISNNTIEIENLKEGNYEFNIYKEDNYFNNPTIFYQAQNSQDLVKTGNINTINIKLKVNVVKTSLEITKIDYDTESIIPQGDAKLDGAIYTILDNNNNKINEITIENNTAKIENINFGTYTIKEKEPGEGYNLNESTYSVTINKNEYNISLIAKNEVIKGNLIIEKKYGEENNLKPENNIKFEIYNSKQDLVDTIITDENGEAKIKLPYGEYIIKQINTTKGYSINEPFIIKIDNQEDKIINLEDLKIKEEEIIEIKVPNTRTNIITKIIKKIIILFLLINIC